MTWLEETVDAFESLGGKAHLQDVYKYIYSNTNRELKSTWRASVRKVIEMHSSDSKAYDGKEDLFTTTEGINKGYWRLRNVEVIAPVAPDRDELDTKEPDKVLSSIYRFQRDTKMVRELKRLYDHECQICGLKIKLKNQSYSEGHHLRPLGRHHKGGDSKNNILILCPNHHVEFDYGVIGIDEELKVIHVNSSNPLNGLPITLKHKLESKYLKYHMENIFNQ